MTFMSIAFLFPSTPQTSTVIMNYTVVEGGKVKRQKQLSEKTKYRAEFLYLRSAYAALRKVLIYYW